MIKSTNEIQIKLTCPQSQRKNYFYSYLQFPTCSRGTGRDILIRVIIPILSLITRTQYKLIFRRSIQSCHSICHIIAHFALLFNGFVFVNNVGGFVDCPYGVGDGWVVSVRALNVKLSN